MPSKLQLGGLIGGMLVTGAANSILSKWQDMQCVENCDDPKTRQLYEQPVWQTLQMFVGEMFCFLPVIYTWLRTIIRSRRSPPVQLPEGHESEQEDAAKPPGHPSAALTGWSVLLMWLPAACDLTGTTLMNVGLLYTPVSIYQMTRGALVLFVGLLSVLFLGRRLHVYQWISLLVVMCGVSLVGLSGSLIKDAIHEDTDVLTMLGRALVDGITGDLPAPEPIKKPATTKVLLGVFFVLFAQIFTATQFVVEEKIMSRYEIAPLLAVGYEGFFGTLSILILLPVTLFFFPPKASFAAEQSPYAGFFDLARGWTQMVNTPAVLWIGFAVMCSISAFNFFGLSVTRHVSATARSLTDTCRTLLIWIVSLGLGWERIILPMSLLQILGFVALVYGTFLFNNLVQPPFKFMRAPPAAPPTFVGADEESRGLLADVGREDALNETAALPADLGQSGFDVVPSGGLGVGKGASSGGSEALRASEDRGFDVAGRARGD